MEKRTRRFHIQQQKKSTGLSGVGGFLRQAQTQSLRPPALLLCTSLKFSKIVLDRVDEGKRGDCIRRGKSYKMGRELRVRYLRHRILSYPKERRALLLHYCNWKEKFTLLHWIIKVMVMHNISPWFEASTAKYMRTAPSWVITQRVVIIYYRSFGTDMLSRKVGKKLLLLV